MELKYNWKPVKTYQEILFHQFEGIAHQHQSSTRTQCVYAPTVQEMIDTMNICREDTSIGVIILTGEGGKAFCSGDQSARARRLCR